MTQRRLLMITYHFTPSAAVAVHRMLGMCRYLPEHGWATTVVAPPVMPWEPTDLALLRKVPPETTVIQVPFRKGGLWNRLQARYRPYRRWHADAKAACLRAIEEQRPDAIYTTSPPGCIHALGLFLKQRVGLPWIACLRDPWITNRRPHEIPALQRWWEKPMEAQMVRQADAIVANTPMNLEGLTAHYPQYSHKMVAILNGFEAEHFPVELPPPAPKSTLTLLHAGELYYGRDPRPLLDAFADLRDLNAEPRLRLQFLGRSTEGVWDLPQEIGTRNLREQVTVEAQVPYADSLKRMLHADILVLIHSPGFRIGVPAKMYEYLGARKPILALAEEDSDIAAVLKQSGLPHRIAPWADRAKIRQALVELSTQVAAGQWTRPSLEDLQPFTRAAMGERFAQCLDRIARPMTKITPALISH